MNNFNEQEIHYRLLKILAEEPRTSQREMASEAEKDNCIDLLNADVGGIVATIR